MVSVIKTSNSPQVVDASQQPLLLVLWRSFSTVLFDVPMTEVMQFLVPSYTVTLVQPLPWDTETGLTETTSHCALHFAPQCLSLHKALAAVHVPHPPTLENWIIPGLKGVVIRVAPLRSRVRTVAI